jgi:hypothetical protein
MKINFGVEVVGDTVFHQGLVVLSLGLGGVGVMVGVEDKFADEGVVAGEVFGVLAFGVDLAHLDVVADEGFAEEASAGVAATENGVGACWGSG